MFCQECGKQIENYALFCPECGTRVTQRPQSPEDGAPSQETRIPTTNTNSDFDAESAQAEFHWTETAHPKPEGESAGSKASNGINKTMERIKNLDKAKKRGIIGGGIAVVLLMAIFAIIVPLFNSVPTDTVRQAFAQSSFATEGAVSSNYTNPSAYEIKDFKVDKQVDAQTSYGSGFLGTTNASYGAGQIKTVYFSGTIANNSFETDFDGQCDFMNVGGNWTPTSTSSLKINSKYTKPLKGIDAGGTSQKTSSKNASYSDFSSELYEANGTYTSKATMTLAFTYWFATDTAKVTQSFTFDQNSGWKASGDPTITDQKTEWTLENKSFKYSGQEYLGDGTYDATITFGNTSNEAVSASYEFGYTAKAGASNSFITFKSASVKGTASGKVSHQFGQEKFSINLNDSDQLVDITCSNSSSENKDKISVTVDTKTEIATRRNGTSSCIELTNCTFEEAAQTSA